MPHFPRGTCECGAALEAAADLGVAASHQEVDIPLETAKVIQHDLHEVACGCGRVHWAAAPAGTGAPGTVTYGLALQAWCVYLMAAHAIPVHRCAELIEALTGAEPSPGFVHSMISRAAAAVADANRAIRCLIILAHVISADETPIRAGPGPKSRKKYPAGRVHQPAHPLLPRRPVAEDLRRVRPARHGRGRHRPRPVPELRRHPGLIHQLCCQHLWRDLADVAQQYPDAHWPGIPGCLPSPALHRARRIPRRAAPARQSHGHLDANRRHDSVRGQTEQHSVCG